MTSHLTSINFFIRLLKDITGQQLREEKAYFIESRLESILPEFGHKNLDTFAEALRQNRDPQAIRRIIDVLSVHETSFFRDRSLFTGLKTTILPEILETRNIAKRLNVLFAGCSTGQEVYSFAMLLHELNAQTQNWRISITATDISEGTINIARAGRYTQFEVQRGLPVQNLLTHFEQQGHLWCIKDSLKENITFSQFNLIDTWAFTEPFDIVFCRNILIYMPLETRQHILNNLAQSMQSHGLLILGGTETLVGVTDKFVACPDLCGIYRKA